MESTRNYLCINLAEFDSYVTKVLKLNKYIRYVDDIIIVSNSKSKLYSNLPNMIKKLEETNQHISAKKTIIDTAYHGVKFLGKVSYPYGYQKPKKTTIIRTYQKAREIEYDNINNLLAKTNSQIGSLKRYNCRKLIFNYSKILQEKTNGVVLLDNEQMKIISNKMK